MPEKKYLVLDEEQEGWWKSPEGGAMTHISVGGAGLWALRGSQVGTEFSLSMILYFLPNQLILESTIALLTNDN